jgi:UDP-N-acetylglucosamine 2-epimerase (non-hydrolysing)
MLQQVLDIFGVEPEENLAIMKPGQDLFDITTAVLTGMRDILRRHKPNLVLVHGDTSTAFASALAAFYQLIPVGHVEAGLRTRNLRSPYPEEMNRQGIDILCSAARRRSGRTPRSPRSSALCATRRPPRPRSPRSRTE